MTRKIRIETCTLVRNEAFTVQWINSDHRIGTDIVLDHTKVSVRIMLEIEIVQIVQITYHFACLFFNYLTYLLADITIAIHD